MMTLSAFFRSGLLVAAAAWTVSSSSAWETVSSPNPGTSLNLLHSVSARTISDAWAAGRVQNVSGLLQPLVMHWQGDQWTVVPVPGVDSIGTFPTAVAVATVPEGDAWFVGTVTLGGNFNRVLVYRRAEDNWNYVRGLTLNSQAIYPYGHRNGFPADIDATAADNVWAVGGADGTGNGATAVALILRWDGSEWIEYNPAEVGSRSNWLYAVEAISHNDVWAVGYYRNWTGLYRGLIYHWDGTAWTHIVHPWEDAAFQTEFQEVVARASDDVWIFGGPQYLHWNGSAWEIIAPPVGSWGVYSADGPSTDDIWSVSSFNAVYYRFNGTQWAIADTLPTPPGATSFFPGRGMGASLDGVTWTVGSYVLDGVTRTFTARQQAALPPVDDLTISFDAGAVNLRWSSVSAADLYDIYATVGDSRSLLESTADTSYVHPLPADILRVYDVVARQNP